MAQLDTEATVRIDYTDDEGNTIPFYYQSVWQEELMKPDLEIVYELD